MLGLSTWHLSASRMPKESNYTTQIWNYTEERWPVLQVSCPVYSNNRFRFTCFFLSIHYEYTDLLYELPAVVNIVSTNMQKCNIHTQKGQLDFDDEMLQGRNASKNSMNRLSNEKKSCCSLLRGTCTWGGAALMQQKRKTNIPNLIYTGLT